MHVGGEVDVIHNTMMEAQVFEAYTTKVMYNRRIIYIDAFIDTGLRGYDYMYKIRSVIYRNEVRARAVRLHL